MPDPFAGIAGASSLLGASSARKAAKSQERAANSQLALQERVYDETVQRFEPYAQQGLDYQNALRYETLGGALPTFGGQVPQITEEQYQTQAMGRTGEHFRTGEPTYSSPSEQRTRYNVGGQSFDDRSGAEQWATNNTTGQQTYTPWEMSAGNLYALNQAQGSIENSAAARGGLFRGSTGNALQQNAIGMSNQYRDQYLNRLTQGAASGQAAAGNQANAGSNYAQGAGQAYGNIGNAQSAGAIGVSNAIQGGFGNVLGVMNYQNLQSKPTGNALSGNGGLY